MPIVSGEQIAPDKIRVRSITYTTNTPPNDNWYSVPSIPEWPEVEIGKRPEMYFNPQTKEFSFEIVDAPLTPEQEKDLEIQRLNQLLDDAISLLLENEVL
jgi:hypothetical protein